MMIHNLEICENYVEPILAKEKNFDIRINDKEFQKGDYINYTEHSATTGQNNKNRLKDKIFKITYVHSGYGLEKDFVILGFKEIVE